MTNALCYAHDATKKYTNMRFESNKDLEREKVAIEKFVGRFGGSYKKLDPNDVDYRIYDSSGELIAYAEVKGDTGVLQMHTHYLWLHVRS